MRVIHNVCWLIALCGISGAQDTNFPVGPQYLITTGSPLFLRPIATPSLSLDASPPSTSIVFAETSSTGRVSEPPVPAPSLAQIYWGGPNTGEGVSVIELSSSERPRNLPSSFVDTGVTLLTDDQSLRLEGYGVTLAQLASQWRAHRPHSSRIYTNRDIERLHGG